MTNLSAGPPKLSALILGVKFTWQNPGPDYSEKCHARLTDLYNSIRESAREALHRQKRDLLLYPDVLTWLIRGMAPEGEVRDSIEHLLAIEFVIAFRDRRVDDELILQFERIPLLSEVRSTFSFHWGTKASGSDRVLSRPRPDGLIVGEDGTLKTRGPGAYRLLELDLEDLEGDASRIDWYRVFHLAVLIHLKCDSEIFLETGFWPIHICERRACRSFFRPNRMAGRQRFCSDVCRACAAREDQPARKARS